MNIEGKKVIVYGAGKYGRATCRIIDEVSFLGDRNPDLVGKTIDGIRVLSVDQIKELSSDYQILVSVHYSTLFSVLVYLRNSGIKSFCIIQRVLSDSNQFGRFEQLL